MCHTLRIVVKPRKHGTDWTVPAITVKFGNHTTYDKWTNTIDSQGQGSKVIITRYILFLNFLKKRPHRFSQDFQTWNTYFLWQDDNTIDFFRSGVKSQGHMLHIVV